MHTCRFFLRWKTIDFALTFLSLMSTLFPVRTIGMFSHTLVKSLCQLGTFLYVTREVTSNITMAHCPDVLLMIEVLENMSTLDVVSVSETTEFLLASCIPDIKSKWPSVCVKDERMHLYSQRGDVFLFKLTSQMALDEGCLPDTTVPDKHQFKGGHFLISGHLSLINL